MSRKYELKKRGEDMAATRLRITEAAIALHGSLGPARTTMSAVAERAGVERRTLYRHFPNEADLFAACSSHYFAAHPWPDLDEWRELNTRWFQFGAFSPIFRSHGENISREIFEMSPQGSPTYRSMVWYDRLRYRLMPYIYTLGADTYFNDDTIMRALVMDFAADRKTWEIGDEYLFGPAFLAAPVTTYKARGRKVYLPAGTSWYDFYTGKNVAGGQTISANAPYERMPLFVRAGSIIPTGPAIQSTSEQAKGPVTLNVYTGANGKFSLYEDDGVSRQYLKGQYSRIPLSYDEAAKSLTIGRRQGSWPGMMAKRTIRIRWIRPGRLLDLDAADQVVTYRGAHITIRAPR